MLIGERNSCFQSMLAVHAEYLATIGAQIWPHEVALPQMQPSCYSWELVSTGDEGIHVELMIESNITMALGKKAHAGKALVSHALAF
jgi:hypothetical protein